VLLVGGAVFWNTGRDERLADAYELPEPGLPVLMSTGQRRYDGLMNAYKQANWPEAEQAVRSLLKVEPKNDTVLYFQAIVLSRTERCSDAIPIFDSLPTSSTFRERALYHAAICHLRLGDRTAAREAMQAMEPVRDPQLAERIRSLLDRL
jgi:predicted Zn-dependent protease